MEWKKFTVITIMPMLSILACAYAETDSRTFTRVSHTWSGPKVISLFLKVDGSGATNVSAVSHGIKSRSYVNVWDNLYLQVCSQGHAKVKDGEWGYYFSFSKDESGKETLLPTDQPGHGITANGVSAFHFRNSDNSGPNEVGPRNVNAPGALRKITYEGFLAEIRILEFKILNARVGKIPSFASLSCLVTVKEN